MTRLDGEKKSPLPWIIGLIVLALLAAGIYYFTASKNNASPSVDTNGAPLQPVPGGPLSDGAAGNQTNDSNLAAANSLTDGNALDANSAMMDNSAMSDNSAMMNNSAMNNSAMSDSNSAMMDNPAMSDSNGAMADNSVSNSAASDSAAPAMTPASANSNAGGNDVIATRSKTIKTDDATVTYKKSVKEDGSLMRDKTIVPNPVQQAKKVQ